MISDAQPATKVPFDEETIRRRINSCPRLASLQVNNRALRDLVNSEQSVTSQIAAIIRRDPSLTARLLRMVNSAYFGITSTVNNIEEAVFFLGLRQIRELAVATPVIEELEHLQRNITTSEPLHWKALWRHSIATANLTREILRTSPIVVDDDTDYVAGLLHNVGKLVMAYSFREELEQVAAAEFSTPAEYCELERQLIGMDHAQIGAQYLERHQVSEAVTFAVRYHVDPRRAPRHRPLAAAVQLADHLIRYSGIECGFERTKPIARDSWIELDGWDILYGADGAEAQLARAAIESYLHRLPNLLSGIM